MHQQAILVTGQAVLGSPGALVSIEDIEKLYSTTQTANAGNNYSCANLNCSVPVIAVITKRKKQGRKNSPSSYFRASKKKHVSGCSRAPTSPQTSTPSSSGGTTQASPHRTKAPAVWIDPLGLAGTAISSGGSSTSGTPSNSSKGKRRVSGTGTSKGHSQRVEKFAKEWTPMNAQSARTTPLLAPWNPQGTYYTAFHPIKFNPTVDVSTIGQKIYVGVLQHVTNNAPGVWLLTLLEKNSNGQTLEVLVQPATFLAGRSGNALLTKLRSLVGATQPSRVFALGIFEPSPTGAFSLSIQHPHYMYIL